MTTLTRTLTDAELEAVTVAEYASLLGRVVHCTAVMGVPVGAEDSERFEAAGAPFRVRVLPTPEEAREFWDYGPWTEWLALCVNVEAADGDPRLAGLTDLWVEVRSRNPEGQVEDGDVLAVEEETTDMTKNVTLAAALAALPAEGTPGYGELVSMGVTLAQRALRDVGGNLDDPRTAGRAADAFAVAFLTYLSATPSAARAA